MDSDQPDLFEIFKAPPKPPKIVRILWRMQGPSRMMVARIERHPYGQELVIAFEDGDEIIETRLAWAGTTGWSRAEEVRELLLAKGWAGAIGSVRER